MGRWFRSLVPAVAALAAVFIVLPQGGGDATVHMVAAGDGWGFRPATVRLEPGGRVAFVNDTGVTHTATCSGCPWDTGDVQPGQTVLLPFLDTAAYRFACDYHGGLGMTGELLVGSGTLPAASPGPVIPTP